MLDGVLEALTGTGLAASAGLNAYIPMILLGVLARFTDVVALPSGWNWLSDGWVIAILAVLLAVEFVADKVPAVDHVNDVLQTVVRPTAGGLVFGAGSGSQTSTVTDPAEFFTSHQWVPVAIGVVVALVVHAAKAAARALVNATTAGLGAPVVSLAEDATSVGLVFVALLLPVLVLLVLALMALSLYGLRRRRRSRRLRKTPTHHG